MKKFLPFLFLLSLVASAQGPVRRAATVAELSAIDPAKVAVGDYVTYEVAGYTYAGDWGGPRAFRWDKASTATVDNGCVFATGGSGRWVASDCASGEINPRWFAAKGTGVSSDTAALQAAISAVPYQGTLKIPPGTYLITNTLTATTAFKWSGSALGSVLLLSSSFPTNKDVIVFSAGAGISFEHLQMENLSVYASSGTPARHILYFNCTNGSAWSQSQFKGLHLVAYNGSAVYIDNSLYDHDAFFTSSFYDCVLKGGVQCYGGGDDVDFIKCAIPGTFSANLANTHGITWNSICNTDTGAGNAKGPQIVRCNITAAGGIRIIRADSPFIANNNIETYGPNLIWTNAACIELAGDSTNAVIGATIFGNQFNPSAGQNDRAIYLDYATSARIQNNEIPQSIGRVFGGVTNSYQGVYISANAWKTDIQPNDWKYPTWFGSGNRMVVNLGRDTYMYRPGALVRPPYGSTISWSNVIADKVIITVQNTNAFTIKSPSFDYLQYPRLAGERLSITITNASGSTMGPITWDSAYIVKDFLPPTGGNQTTVDFYLNYDLLTWIEDKVSQPWSSGGTVITGSTNMGVYVDAGIATRLSDSGEVLINMAGATNAVMGLADYSIDPVKFSTNGVSNGQVWQYSAALGRWTNATIAGTSYTFSTGLTNSGGTVTAMLAPGANITFTTNAQTITIASTATGSGTNSVTANSQVVTNFADGTNVKLTVASQNATVDLNTNVTVNSISTTSLTVTNPLPNRAITNATASRFAEWGADFRLTNSIAETGTGAPVRSNAPAFTNPTANTQSIGTSNSTLATTAFVMQNQPTNGGTGTTYTFTNGVVNTAGVVSANIVAGSNVSLTTNGVGLVTIAAIGATNLPVYGLWQTLGTAWYSIELDGSAQPYLAASSVSGYITNIAKIYAPNSERICLRLDFSINFGTNYTVVHDFEGGPTNITEEGYSGWVHSGTRSNYFCELSIARNDASFEDAVTYVGRIKIITDSATAGGMGGDVITTANNVMTGSNSFTGGTITVPTQSLSTSNSTAASTAFVMQNRGSGDVVGPASSVSNNLPAFGSTTGKLLKDSGVAVTNVQTVTGANATFVPITGATPTVMSGAGLSNQVFFGAPTIYAGSTNLLGYAAGKAPIASPTFTGDAQAVTPAARDSDTSIPTTEWVQQELNSLREVGHMTNIARYSWQQTDFYTGTTSANMCLPWEGASIGGGLPGSGLGEVNHPGILPLSAASGATQTGYYAHTIYHTVWKLNGKDIFTLVWRPKSTNNANITRFGFHNSITASQPQDAVMILQSNNIVSGYCISNNTPVRTSSQYSCSSNSWYRGGVLTSADLSVAYFMLLTGSNTVVWADSLTNCLPIGRSLGHGVSCLGTNSSALADLDFMGAGVGRVLDR